MILLVEDETSITEPLAEALRREGFETDVAGTVAEALELELKGKVAIISGGSDGMGRAAAERLASEGGGATPVWRRDGKELYYTSTDDRLVAVSVSLRGGALELGVGLAAIDA